MTSASGLGGRGHRGGFACVGKKRLVANGRVVGTRPCAKTVSAEGGWCGQCRGHRDDVSDELGRMAAKAVAAGSADAAPRLTARYSELASHPDSAVRVTCAQMVPDTHLGVLSEMFVGDRDESVRHALWCRVETDSGLHDAAFLDAILERGFNDPSESVAVLAARAVANRQRTMPGRPLPRRLRRLMAAHWSMRARDEVRDLIPPGVAQPASDDRSETLAAEGSRLRAADIETALADPADPRFGLLAAAVRSPDAFGGFAQWAVFVERVAMAASVSTSGGRISGAAVTAVDASTVLAWAAEDAHSGRGDSGSAALRAVAAAVLITVVAVYRAAEQDQRGLREEMFDAACVCLRCLSLPRCQHSGAHGAGWDTLIAAWMPMLAEHAAASPGKVTQLMSMPFRSAVLCCAAAGAENADRVLAAVVETMLRQGDHALLMLRCPAAGPLTGEAVLRAGRRMEAARAAIVNADGRRPVGQRILTDAQMDRLAATRGYSIGMAIGGSPHATPEALARLASSPHLAVRYRVATHDATSEAALTLLAIAPGGAENSRVSGAALLSLADRRAMMP